MKKMYLVILGALLFCSCNKEKSEITFDQELLQKVLVVPSNETEFRYFQESIQKYRYTISGIENTGVRYIGKRRTFLSIFLLSPGSHTSGKFGIIQLKGHTVDMENCLDRVENNIIPGKTVIVIGGCESTSSETRKKLQELGVRCISVDGIGQGRENDYLVMQLHTAFQDADSFEEAIERIKERAPETFKHYTF
jgi:hypothetical protein